MMLDKNRVIPKDKRNMVLVMINIFLGTLSVYMAVSKHTLEAIILVFLVSAIDAINWYSIEKDKDEYGVYLHSMSDIVSYCIAPSMMIMFTFMAPVTSTLTEHIKNLSVVIATIIVLFAGVGNLLRFSSGRYKDKMFHGLPTSVNAMLVCLITLLFYYGLVDYNYLPVGMLAIIVSSILVIADVEYVKFTTIKSGTLVSCLVLMYSLFIVMSLVGVILSNRLVFEIFTSLSLIYIVVYILFGAIIPIYLCDEENNGG